MLFLNVDANIDEEYDTDIFTFFYLSIRYFNSINILI